LPAPLTVSPCAVFFVVVEKSHSQLTTESLNFASFPSSLELSCKPPFRYKCPLIVFNRRLVKNVVLLALNKTAVINKMSKAPASSLAVLIVAFDLCATTPPLVD
jgi:hypothetical protein